MIVRTLFFLFLAANIGLYSWQVMNPPPEPQPEPAVDPGVPSLVLLREREQELLQETDDPARLRFLADTNCFSIGPFNTQADLRRAFNAIAPHIEKSQQRQTTDTRDRGFWVYLPAVDTREDALAVARELATAGLKDYYVVTAGDQQNTVSLGLFRDRSNAERRQSALQSLGFDAQVTRRTESTLVYWLDYARKPGSEPPWERIVASDPDLRHRPINCFR